MLVHLDLLNTQQSFRPGYQKWYRSVLMTPYIREPPLKRVRCYPPPVHHSIYSVTGNRRRRDVAGSTSGVARILVEEGTRTLADRKIGVGHDIPSRKNSPRQSNLIGTLTALAQTVYS